MSGDLANRFRPSVLGDVELSTSMVDSGLYALKGQRSVSAQLKKFFLADYLSQFFILFGPKGVGKTTTARIFAKMVNCLEPFGPEGEKIHPCNKCSSCVGINNSTFQDVIEVNGSDNTGVDDARRIIDSTAYLPVAGKGKVYIIDECHYLTRNSFNSFLKILESPPKNVYFLLVTTEPGRIPDTIHSRAHSLYFRALSLSDLKDVIKSVCGVFVDSEEDTTDFIKKSIDDLSTAIAMHSDGSARNAIKLYEKIVDEGGLTTESIKRAIDSIGMANKEFIQNLVLALINEDYYTTITLIEQAVALEFDFVRICRFMSNFFIDLAVAQKVGSIVFCEMFGDFIEANVGIFKDVDGVSMFFKLFELERNLDVRNDKNLFLAAMFGLGW